MTQGNAKPRGEQDPGPDSLIATLSSRFPRRKGTHVRKAEPGKPPDFSLGGARAEGRGSREGSDQRGGARPEGTGSQEGQGQSAREEYFRHPRTAPPPVPTPARTGIENESRTRPSVHCNAAHSSQTRKQIKCLSTEEWIKMWPVIEQNIAQP